MSLLPTQFRSLTLKIESKFSFQAREDSAAEIRSIRDAADIFCCAHEKSRRSGKRKNVALLASLYVV